MNDVERSLRYIAKRKRTSDKRLCKVVPSETMKEASDTYIYQGCQLCVWDSARMGRLSKPELCGVACSPLMWLLNTLNRVQDYGIKVWIVFIWWLILTGSRITLETSLWGVNEETVSWAPATPPPPTTPPHTHCGFHVPSCLQLLPSRLHHHCGYIPSSYKMK